MRSTLLSWLPEDLRGVRMLDAGCGTGAFAVEAARRGASVVAIDLSPTLVGLARERIPRDLGAGAIEFRVGDMTDPTLGRFDHVVAMDSLIHYVAGDVVRAVAGLAARADALGAVHVRAPDPAAGGDARGRPACSRAATARRRSSRSRPEALHRRLAAAPDLASVAGRRAASACSRGFYTSQALELRRA